MKDPKKPEKDSESTEREIRRQRKFSLTEAVARQGAGNLKGASPVAKGRQAMLAIRQILETGLPDAHGSLRRTILAHLEQDPLLVGRHLADPPGALEEYLQGILEQTARLEALVRDADARWGRDYQEKPIFETPGRPPDPDDPYTVEGVRNACRQLLDRLDTG